jgi:hypothetical protein
MNLKRRPTTNLCLPALLLAVCLALLASASPASAGKQRLQTGIVGDQDAKLSMVLQKGKSGKPTRIKSLKVTGYDLRCKSIPQPDKEGVFEADFAFPAMKVVPKRKGVYRYSFTGEHGAEDPFSAAFGQHTGTAEGWFATARSGKPTKLVGYLQMAALSYSLPGMPPPSACGDPLRDDPFQKLHGSFSVPLR